MFKIGLGTLHDDIHLSANAKRKGNALKRAYFIVYQQNNAGAMMFFLDLCIVSRFEAVISLHILEKI
jgi:hypothetical protein